MTFCAPRSAGPARPARRSSTRRRRCTGLLAAEFPGAAVYSPPATRRASPPGRRWRLEKLLGPDEYQPDETYRRHLRQRLETANCGLPQLRAAGSPTRNRRLRSMSTTATTPKRMPTRMDPIASQTPSPVSWWRPIPSVASAMPTNAAASSANTARLVGSDVSSTWPRRSRPIGPPHCGIGALPGAARRLENERDAQHDVGDEIVLGLDSPSRSSLTPRQTDNDPPTTNRPTAANNDHT